MNAPPESPVRKLGARYPCCGIKCRHDLQVGIEREVACPHCGQRYLALLVACGEHAVRMAGRPVGRVQFTQVAA